MISKKLLPLLGFTCLVVILSAIALFSPWWNIYSSRESQIESNMTIRVRYYLTGSIDAKKLTSVENESVSMVISVSELNASDESKVSLQSFLTVIRYLTVGGLGLNVLLFVLVCISSVYSLPLEKYTKFLSLIAAIIFFVAFIYFASEWQLYLSKIQRIAPTEVCTLPGNQIKSLFGNVDSLVYAPSFGWYLAFVIFLLNISIYIINRKLESRP